MKELSRKKERDGWDALLSHLGINTLVYFDGDDINDETIYNKRLAHIANNIEQSIVEKEYKEQFPDMLFREDVETLLIEKNIIEIDEKYEDLKFKEAVKDKAIL